MRKANHAVWDEAGSFWPLGGSECSRLPFRDANRHLTPHNLGKRPPDPTNRVHVDPKQINGTGRMNRTQLRCIAGLKFISVDVAGRKAHSFQCCFHCDRCTNHPVSQLEPTRWVTHCPVSYRVSLLPSIRKITLWRKWSSLITNGSTTRSSMRSPTSFLRLEEVYLGGE